MFWEINAGFFCDFIYRFSKAFHKIFFFKYHCSFGVLLESVLTRLIEKISSRKLGDVTDTDLREQLLQDILTECLTLVL